MILQNIAKYCYYLLLKELYYSAHLIHSFLGCKLEPCIHVQTVHHLLHHIAYVASSILIRHCIFIVHFYIIELIHLLLELGLRRNMPQACVVYPAFAHYSILIVNRFIKSIEHVYVLSVLPQHLLQEWVGIRCFEDHGVLCKPLYFIKALLQLRLYMVSLFLLLGHF